MATPEELTRAVHLALGSEPRIGVAHHPIRLGMEWGDLVMEGEVEDVAAKKLALERAAAIPGVDRIIDKLRVRPARKMTDGQVLQHACDALLGEPAMQHIGVRVRDGKEVRDLRVAPPGSRGGTLEVRVEDGVVTLDGDVGGLGAKRLAEVLVWWIPGVRDVVNGLGVDPREQDNDGEMAESVRIALEKDPLVDAGSIQVATRHGVVTLTGAVPSSEQRHIAEMDAWYVWGVDRVVNRLQVVH
ncbi:BON domain-containing protein [Pyxidicoccus parkwayensis]|uniref:BON domain-containing protein n=1 Tax=Pyxidicoccus parkwayensis TaxID=2813578 RepID=A0ABX7NNF6_9BACT|nr:BON domain-containing protein [Pyxidicoccus parkwaysis]QSQ19057.1 BON domain-containing protein [Pyxidicoccus parkwaysis]